MKVRVLGSAAGGGFPQWNCHCRNCHGVRTGSIRASARTQSSIAVGGSPPGLWTLVNASPDIRQQLEANPDLQRGRALRDSAIAALVLVDAQLDHTVGLYTLRESSHAWPVWCTDDAYADLEPAFAILRRYCGVIRQRIDLADEEFVIEGVGQVRWRAVPVIGVRAPYSSRLGAAGSGDTIGLSISNEITGKRLWYAPGLGGVDALAWRSMQESDCVLVDGTFWNEDELVRLGLSHKHARDMGHLPLSGAGGLLEWLERLPLSVRKILIHVNNTNPILDENSPERAALAERCIEVAYDAMEIEL